MISSNAADLTTEVPMSLAEDERASLEAARDGDEAAFGALVEPHRAGLHAHCYQMLASVQDAEDALQEALLRAWQRLGQFEGRASFRTWLYTIATRTTLDLTSQRPKRILPLDAELVASSGGETASLEPFPADQLGLASGFASPEARYELHESVELAFIAAVQHLAPRQRAMLLLRDVLGFSAVESAETLGMTVAAANSALERARATITRRCPDPSQQATLRSIGDGPVHDLVTRYTDALERADLEAMLDLLVEDATWAMPPSQEWYRGRHAIRQFLVEGPFAVRWRHIPTRANGQIAIGCYLWEPATQQYEAAVLDVLTLAGRRIAAITAFFIDKGSFPSFGLPLAVGEPPSR